MLVVLVKASSARANAASGAHQLKQQVKEL